MDNTNKKLTAIVKAINNLKKGMATKHYIQKLKSELKQDISGMATKKDLEAMATKDDINNMATKDDIKNMATKDDIKNMATKDDIKTLKSDIKALEIRLLEKIDESEMEIITVVDEHKKDKETVEVLKKRVDRLEDNVGLPPFADQ